MSSKVTVVVFGVTGYLSEHVFRSLQCPYLGQRIEYPIKAISRSEHTSTDKIEYIKGDLANSSDVDNLISKLKGTTVFIELLGPRPEVLAATERIANEVKPKLFIPSSFGLDLEQVHSYAPEFFHEMTDHADKLRSYGIKTIALATSYNAIPGSYLYECLGALGVDSTDKSYVIKGDINQELAITRGEDIGHTTAVLATFEDYSKLPDTVRIFSEIVTVKQVIERYEENHKVKLTLKGSETAPEALKDFLNNFSEDLKECKFLPHLHSIVAQGLDKGTLFSEDHRELVNPGQSMWKWGKF